MEQIIKALKSRNINGHLAKDKSEALEVAISLIDKSQQISLGGSLSVKQIGLFDELNNGEYKLVNRYIDGIDSFTKHFIQKNGSTHGIFIAGTNALTEDGKIVNMDGWGNRTNAISYGPDKVILIIGKNKIVKTLDDALERIADVASPPNTKRLNFDTPCAKTGKCVDCRSPERICNILNVIQFQREPDRMHIILVDEELGY